MKDIIIFRILLIIVAFLFVNFGTMIASTFLDGKSNINIRFLLLIFITDTIGLLILMTYLWK